MAGQPPTPRHACCFAAGAADAGDRRAKYAGANVLAPMVRCGTLPLRLFALESGAHLAYGEELVSMRFEKAARVSNERLGSADVVGHDGRVLFRTLERERGRCIFQLGTGDGASALRAAELVARDVAAVDLNMGCPKKFSTSGGMGAALLREPERAEDILKTLRRNLPATCGVSCKIRLLDDGTGDKRTFDPRASVELARRLEACGIDALAVHCRMPDQRTREPAFWEHLAPVRDAIKTAALVLNGDVYRYEDFDRARAATGADAAMAARSAMWNPTVFSPHGMMSKEDAMRRFAELCLETDNILANTKYTLKEMQLGGGAKWGRQPTGSLEDGVGKGINRAKTYRELFVALDHAAWHDDFVKGLRPQPTRCPKHAGQQQQHQQQVDSGPADAGHQRVGEKRSGRDECASLGCEAKVCRTHISAEVGAGAARAR